MKCFSRVAAALVAMLFFTSAQADSIADYRQYFGALDERIEQAKENHVDVLSPESFDRAMKYHKEAVALLRQRRSTDGVLQNISRTKQWLGKAEENAELAGVVFGATIQGRNNAVSADAPNFASEAWADAEKAMRKAAEDVEDGDIRDAKDDARKVTALYKQAELLAIKENYLSGARALLKQADKVGADKYAPKTFIDAKLLLEEAERELTENRYDTDYPRDLARRARNEAQHAINIAKLSIGVKKKDFAVEDIVINYEGPLIAIADALDIVPSLHRGYEPTREVIIETVKVLQKESQELGQLRLVSAEQAEEIKRLSAQLGIYNEQLAAEERYRALLAELEGIFTPVEAEIFRQGKNMIIRMVGLNFASGKSELTIDHMKLLAKVKYAIELSKTDLTTIEGHTDAFGGDDSNQKLSEDRANAVVAWMKQDSRLANANMVAVGYGETRPIANNESAAGREKNRRIDVVIKLDKAKAQAKPETFGDLPDVPPVAPAAAP